MADKIEEVINKINPSIKAGTAEEKQSGDRKLVTIKTGVKAVEFSDEAEGKLKIALECAGGMDDRKQPRVCASVGRDKDGYATIVIDAPKDVVLDTKILAAELRRPDAKTVLQELNAAGRGAEPAVKAADSAKAAVQNGRTTPAAAVKVGQVGRGSQLALRVGERNEETVRGSADYRIMQDKDGRLTALVDLGYGDPQLLKSTDTVKQQITATLDGVDGRPPKRVTFDIGKDGTLAEVKTPAATPKGNERTEGPMR